MLIAGNSKTVALGPGGMALAPGLPLGLGWFIRRRLDWMPPTFWTVSSA